jgi:hypothetical protein
MNRMLSYKKIDLLNLVLKENILYYDSKILTIKSPIINYDIMDDKIMLKVNGDADSHITFLNLCSYIERLFKNLKIKTDIIGNRNDIDNRSIIISINEKSKFFDINKEEIFRNNLKNSGKIMCSFSCENGKIVLCQLLQIK